MPFSSHATSQNLGPIWLPHSLLKKKPGGSKHAGEKLPLPQRVINFFTAAQQER
jgi:hypothetical protein